MSREDVQALRDLYEEWSKGNFWTGGELFVPDVVFEPFAERTTVRGMENVSAYMREFLAQWSDYRVEARELTEANGSIVVKERQYARGKWSGIDTVKTFYAVWTFHQGRVARVRWEDDPNAALEAVGLRE